MQIRNDGSRDVLRSIDRLARRLPEPLEDLARIAYNYLWAWVPGGKELFRGIDAYRFSLAGENPVAFLSTLPERDLLHAATDKATLERLRAVVREMDAELTRASVRPASDDPVAFFCAEFAIHSSLPVYSGGLGVLAGDFLKEASDQGLNVVGIGLLYRRGYLHQRMDLSGWQREYWIEANTDQLPAVRVRDEDGTPLKIKVPVWDGELSAHVWRVDVGRTPLYLLDTELVENDALERWVTARLYEGSSEIRLAQYALLGIGGVRALNAMGITPSKYHLNEGHAALASLEVATQGSDERRDVTELLAQVRDRFIFTTHTPVPAGNETYDAGQFFSVLGGALDEMKVARDQVAAASRVDPTSGSEPLGLSVLALRTAHSTNAVSKIHGDVARAMWMPLFPGTAAGDVPITHVTNGVHLPTWMVPNMRELLTKYFGVGWEQRAHDPGMWKAIDEIPDEELWRVRCEARSELVSLVRTKATVDRLARGEDIDYVEAALEAFDPSQLTIGFARRLATYKRLELLLHDPARFRTIVDHEKGTQFVIAGKAHPRDEEAKSAASRILALKRDIDVPNRVVFLEDYDLRIALRLVAGADVWLNLPRPPMEASGTSGMKAAMNGSLNFSVLDGWWDEGYNGENGWAIDGSPESDQAAQDERDANALYGQLENKVKPLFYERDANDIPVGWLRMVRSSLQTLAPMYSAARMVNDYVGNIYDPSA
jgi:starch phosphorylase